MGDTPLGVLKAALAGVPAEWRELFKGASSELGRAVAAVADAQRAGLTVVPALPQVFEAFRYVLPADVVAVVVAQDPYHTVVRAGGEVHMQAQGLCFSCNPSVPAAQPSLANIRDAVVCDLVAASPGPEGRTDEAVAALCAALSARGAGTVLHDLRFWAAQGVLLLNRALTTVEGKAGAHEGVWAGFTHRVVAALLDQARAAGRPPPPFLLWGGAARALAALVRASKGLALEWTHPSPLSDNRRPLEKKFRSCGHFRQANAAAAAAGIRQVVWLELPTVAASDGSCSKNGSADAKAGYGACVVAGPLRGLEIAGPVAPHFYSWVDPANPLLGFRPVPGAVVAPTNIRGEFLAACYLFLALARAAPTRPVEVVFDLELIPNTLLHYMPAWKRKGIVEKKKNPDLTVILDALYRQVCARAAVTLTHHLGHQSAPLSGDAAAARKWEANRRADELAKRGQTLEAPAVTPPFHLPR